MMLTAIGRRLADIGCDWTIGHEQLDRRSNSRKGRGNWFLDAKRRQERVCLGLVTCLLHDLRQVYPPSYVLCSVNVS